MKFKKVDMVPIIIVAVLAAIIILLVKAGLPSVLGSEKVTYTVEGSLPQEEEAKITLISYNMHYGSGRHGDYIKNAEGQDVYKYLKEVADIIKDADIVALQEADVSVKRSHFVDQAEYIAEAAGFGQVAFADNWNFKLFPFTTPVFFSKARTGHAILSKLPIEESHTVVFEKPRASLWHKMFFLWRTQQYTDINVYGTTIRVFNVHLESESRTDREDQAHQLVDMAKASPHPTVLMGDFNALPPEASKKDFPGREYIGDSTISTIRTSGLSDILPPGQYEEDEQAYMTFPAKEPTRRLDYFFHTDDITVNSWEILDEPEASDHLPLAVEIQLNK
jgi:endonuclease/exonuclease/phosphatase family metal-dependent hydrolase